MRRSLCAQAKPVQAADVAKGAPESPNYRYRLTDKGRKRLAQQLGKLGALGGEQEGARALRAALEAHGAL